MVLADQDEVDLSQELAVQAYPEVLLRHRLERTKVRLARGADERIEGARLFEQLLYGCLGADVHLEVPAFGAHPDDLVLFLERGDHFFTNGPAGADDCPVTAAIDVIGGKWKPILIYILMDGTRRFGELHKAIPGMALKVLSRQLKELEQDGIVRRQVFAEVPPRVEYSLTEKGESLSDIMMLLSAWSRRNILVDAAA